MDEISKKLSIANKGKPSPTKGKNLSEETRKKISESLKKRYDEGMTPPNQGKKFSDETRRKMSESTKKKCAEGFINRVIDYRLIHMDDTVIDIHGNLKKTCNELGLQYDCMFRVLKGKQSHHRGWRVERL